uniref:Uncharacterized protein n=1 Tax=Panagrolaimus superbus TaxID=310955 RepID=A0A914YSU5_9BILA
MNSIRSGNYGNNGNGNGQNYGSSNYNLGNNGFSSTAAGNTNFNVVEGYGNSGGGGSNQWTGQQINNGFNGFGSTNSNGGTINGLSGISGTTTTGNNGFGINGFTSNGNSNFNAIPVRIITTGGGYGCCNMNSFGPCCQPQQQTFTQPQTYTQPQTFNTFVPNHSSFGGLQSNPINDVPGPIPHASYSPPSTSPSLSSSSATISSPQQSPPTFDYSNTLQNNVPFSPQPLQQKQNDAITSATFDFYPQQHVNTNQYLPSSPYQSQQQQQQTQEYQHFKNPYGSAAF